jgi:outer membrane protein assembly factor BamB
VNAFLNSKPDAVDAGELYVDGKVYVGTEDGDIVVFTAGKNRKVFATVGVAETVHPAPVVANGVLYVTTKSKLFAIK